MPSALEHGISPSNGPIGEEADRQDTSDVVDGVMGDREAHVLRAQSNGH
jgi:hypothetical protein